ncbi:hypothetical protein [Xenorhabdus sp. TH1]|uniref:ParB/RepB/Spo0J family partition protein n=1 Tax=Xenorhabdus sp. TH1 TaxID=3130166 RepID=UPI0030CD8C80
MSNYSQRTEIVNEKSAPNTLKKFAAAHKERVSSSSSIFNVPPEFLYVVDGFNLREIDEEHAKNFKKSYEAGVYVPPLIVKVVTVDDKPRLKVIDGHHRYLAVQMAKEAGVKIEAVSVTEFTGSKQDEIINMITSAEGKPLTPLEKAAGFYRLTNWGWSKKLISERTGNSIVTIERLLRLYRVDDDRITTLVKENLITADLAIEIIVECEGNGKDPYDVMNQGLQNAKASGKNKITRKSVPSQKTVPFTKKELVSYFSSLSTIKDEVTSAINKSGERDTTVNLTVPTDVLSLLSDTLAKWQESVQAAEKPHNAELPADHAEPTGYSLKL